MAWGVHNGDTVEDFFKDNPAGNADEQTPLVIVRK
jgi:hypothetical protein